MKIALPKTVRFLDFGGYDPDQPKLAGLGIYVWVDPPRAVVEEYDRINRDFARTLTAATAPPVVPPPKHRWWQKLLPRWSSRTKSVSRPRHSFLDLLAARKKMAGDPALEAYHRLLHAWYANLWSQGLEGTHIPAADVAELDEQNPAFLEWLQRASWVLIEQHRADIKKGLRPQAPTPGEPATGS